MSLSWTWDPEKDRKNRRKHGLSFDLARRVFDDPLALSRPDPCPSEERWQTIGMIRSVHVLVVHTAPETDAATGDAIGRVISARKAMAHERKAYEEGAF
jgi:uncharacterized protein